MSDLWLPPLPLQTCFFTSTEVDQKTPASFSLWSIGEEISESHIVQIAWSSPGLAKHQRCALAVLTSNLVLSIWVSVNPIRTMVSSWKRVTIINHALMEYFDKTGPFGKKTPDLDMSMEKLKFQRIRSFAWASPLCVPSNATRSAHMIAVCNDEMQIILLRVKVSFNLTTHGNPSNYTVEPLSRIDILNATIPRPTLAWTLDDYLSNETFIRHIAWSPWTHCNDASLCSILAFATRDYIGFRQVNMVRINDELTITSDKIDFTIPIPQTCSISGPFEFSPISGRDSKTLVTVVSDEIISCTIPLKGLSINPEEPQIYRRKRDAWSDVAGRVKSFVTSDYMLIEQGLGFTKTATEDDILLTVPQDGLTESNELDFDLPTLQPLDADQNTWKEDVITQQTLFGLEKAVGPHVNALTWGLTTSRLGNFVAVISCFLPSRSPHYIISADRRSVLFIKSTSPDAQSKFPVPRMLDFDSDDCKSEKLSCYFYPSDFNH
jgi:hypothetical protein